MLRAMQDGPALPSAGQPQRDPCRLASACHVDGSSQTPCDVGSGLPPLTWPSQGRRCDAGTVPGRRMQSWATSR